MPSSATTLPSGSTWVTTWVLSGMASAATHATFVAVCLGASATDKLGVFLESYNYFTKEKHQSTDASWNLDFGLNYMLNQRLQLDLYSGFNLQHPKDGVFVGAGVAWRIK